MRKQKYCRDDSAVAFTTAPDCVFERPTYDYADGAPSKETRFGDGGSTALVAPAKSLSAEFSW